VSRMTLTCWVHRLNRQGLAGQQEKPRAGRPTQLTARLRRQLSEHLKQSPERYALPRVVWDAPTLVSHLRRRFGVPLKGSTGKVLVAPFGLGLEACPRRLPQAKAEDVEKFRRGVKKDSVNGRKNEVLIFEDETGFSQPPRVSRVWARKGEPFRVPTRREPRKRLNILGWVDPLGGRHGMRRAAQGNTQGFLRLLRQLRRSWQNHPSWGGRSPWAPRAAGAEVPGQTSRCAFEVLPPYQPRFNPQERIWHQVRYERTNNRWFPDLDETWKAIRDTSRRRSVHKVKRLCNIL